MTMAVDFSENGDRIEHNLRNHAPLAAVVGWALDHITEASIAYSRVIDQVVPSGREKQMALTDVERASQSAKAGIARNQGQFPADAPAPTAKQVLLSEEQARALLRLAEAVDDKSDDEMYALGSIYTQLDQAT